MSDAARIVLTTCPDAATAERMARTLVEERLAACVNVLAGMRSIYRWKGAVETADEVLLVVKTTVPRMAELVARLTELHPYDVPEAIALDLAACSKPYLAWIQESVTPP
jgi:periplasmic divalent cation tolerance protein